MPDGYPAQPYDVNPIPPAQAVKVRYEDPSVIKYLVENREFLEMFAKIIRGFAQMPNMATGELEWIDTKKPLINESGALWLLGRLAVATDKMIYLSNYPEARLKPILRVEFEEISSNLVAHMEEYGLDGASAIYIMGIARDIIESAYHRPVNDKERRHIFGAVDESVATKPHDGKLLGGLMSKF